MDSSEGVVKNVISEKKMTFVNGIFKYFNEIYAIINYNILMPWRQN